MSLPPELSRLGEDLHEAARREVARRRRAWTVRTAVLGALLASLSMGLTPQTLGPAKRGAEAIPVAEVSRCTDAGSIRRRPCSDPPAFITDAAAGRHSQTIVAHLGDAAQSGRPQPWRAGPGPSIF